MFHRRNECVARRELSATQWRESDSSILTLHPDRWGLARDDAAEHAIVHTAILPVHRPLASRYLP